MDSGTRPDAVTTNLGLMSDEDLYQVYLKALGYPKSRLNGNVSELYQSSRLKRQMTSLDALTYFSVLAFTAGQNPGVLLIFFFLLVASIVNVTAGPFGLGGYIYYMQLASETVEPPARDSINLHSPEVLYYVANYLTSPILANARVLTKNFQAEASIVDKFLVQTQELRDGLQQELGSLTDESLRQAYVRRIDDADKTVSSLQEKHDAITARITRILAETDPIERPLQELKVLSQSGQRLRTIQSLTNDSPILSNDVSALDSFAGLQARVEMARENLRGLGSHIEAYEEARQEVAKLGIGNGG
jgi:hypothetical protein